MPKFNVTVNWTRTSAHSVEIEVSAKTEEEAEVKVGKQIDKVRESVYKEGDHKSLMDSFEWDFVDEDDEFEYEVNEA